MRFLDTRICAFVIRDPERAKFAILSHTWDAGGEQSYMKLSEIQKRHDLEVHCPRYRLKYPLTPSSSSLESQLDTSPLPLPTGSRSTSSV